MGGCSTSAPAPAPSRLHHSASSADVVLVQGVGPSAPSAEVSPAFAIIDVDVHDGPAFGRYVQGHMPGLRAAGGQFLAAGGRMQVIEGARAPRADVALVGALSEKLRVERGLP